ncbi:Hypothetical predicted protein [Cloeon dipterum]|uniref:C-type lectin domain-containing protein n=1 Tax=Cloeon dipterum TaxID=197152 RepID=A0A8S1BV61_9INSE|nr:Hypothetical predicted protein [Cloeon dipterum]
MLSRLVLLLVCVCFAASSAQYNSYGRNVLIEASTKKNRKLRYDKGVVEVQNGPGLESPLQLESTIQQLRSQLDADRENTISNFKKVRTNLMKNNNQWISAENELRETKQLVQELKAKVNLSITEDGKSKSDIKKLKSQLDSDREAIKSDINLLRNEFGTLKNEQANLKAELRKFVRELKNQDSFSRSRIRELGNHLVAYQNSLTSKIDGTKNGIKTLKNDQDTLKSEVRDANQQFMNQLQQLNTKLAELSKQKRWAVFTLGNGKTYHFSLQRNTWYMAKKICEERGMRLASPKTQEEISLLHQKLTELEPESGFWLSASDEANKGVEYQWLDGEVLPLNSSLWEKERLADDIKKILVCLFFATSSAQYNQQYNPYDPYMYNGGAGNQAAKDFLDFPPSMYEPTIGQLNSELDTLRKDTIKNFQAAWYHMELIYNRQTIVEAELIETKRLVQELTAKFNLLTTKAELQKVIGELKNQDVQSKDINKLKSQLDSDRKATKSEIKMLQNELGPVKNEQTYFKDELQRVVEKLKNQEVKSNSEIYQLKSQLEYDWEATNSNITTLRKEFGTMKNDQDNLKVDLQKFVRDELRNQDVKSNSDLNKLKSQLESDWEANNSNITTLRHEFGTIKNDQDNLKAGLLKFEGELKNQDVKSKSDIKKLKSQLDSDREATKSNITTLRTELGTLNTKQTHLKEVVGGLRSQDVKSKSAINKLNSQLDADRETTKSKITTLQTEFGNLKNKQTNLKDELQKVVGELNNQDVKSNSEIYQLKSRLDSDWEATNSNITTLRHEFGTIKNDQDNLKDELHKFEGELMNQDSSCKSRFRELGNRFVENEKSLNSKIDGTKIDLEILKMDQDSLKFEVSKAKQQFGTHIQELNATLMQLSKPEPWIVSTLTNGKTYHFSLEDKTWYKAKKICEEEGMRLASPKTQEEISLLYHKLEELKPRYGFWLSASDEANIGVEFQWLDGEVLPLNSTLWEKERVADDVRKGPASCVFIRKALKEKLHKAKCTEFTNFICEMQ